MKIFGDPRRAIIKKKYHPMGEYSKAKASFIKNGQYVVQGKFHKLAQKLERTIPRGLREKGDPKYITTSILLEVINEDRN